MRGVSFASAIALGCAFVSTPAFAIQGGAVDTTHGYAVGIISTISEGTFCSGVLITPNLVLTSRQCVQGVDYKNPAVPGTIDCTLSPTFTGAMKSVKVSTTPTAVAASARTVKSIAVPNTDAVCGNDLALIVLDDLVDAAVAVPVAPAVNEAPNHPKYQRKLAAIGYGATTATSTDTGTRRALEQIPIACVPGDATFPCPASFDAAELAGGDGLCDYDIGLGGIEQASFTNGTPVALGVLSRHGADMATCVGSIFTRLDVHRDFIVGAAESASNNWTLYGKPRWADPPPAPDGGPGDEDAGAEAGGGTTTTPSPGGGRISPDAGTPEEPAADGSGDDGGCRAAPRNGPIGAAALLAGAVALALAKRRRNRS